MSCQAARRIAGRLRTLSRFRVLPDLWDTNPAAATIAGVWPPQANAASQLWKYPSPLLRHLSSSALNPAPPRQPSEDVIDSLPDYGHLKHKAQTARASLEQQLELLPGELEGFQRVMRHFQHSAAVKDQALGLYVNAKLFRVAIQHFADFLLLGMTPPLRDTLLELGPGPEAANALFPLFAQYVLDHHMDDIRAYRDIVRTADLRKPHLWFPVARSLTRHIVYHSGPTNSGKTYNALVAMKGAASGVYCGPLRLLAMEIYDACNADGTYCNLVTGQERRAVPGAQHTACTVEMVNMQRRVDVAVIDEIQMMGDEHRGWAWTRALMGVPANEVHVCGDGSAVDLVRRICEEMGEPFELRTYDRFTTLEVEGGGLENGYSSVQPGDCIVAFSRKDIYSIKQLIEQETQHRACVVYGGLPPETRRTQARLFNDANTRYKVLVASDAVGMGLNLNIRRIIFHSMTKFEGGRKRVPVSVSMVKQIAGRAGRRSSQWSQGLATCRDARDVPKLRAALQVPLDQLSTPIAGLFPEFEHLEVFAGQHPDEPFRLLLTMFGENALLDSAYFFCKQDSVLGAAQLLGEIPLSLKDMYHFCMAPASSTDLRLAAALLQFATKYARGTPVELSMELPRRIPANVEELKHLEAAHQVAMLWLWLSYRFDDESFPDRDRAEKMAAATCDLLDKGLERVTRACKRGVDVSVEPARSSMEAVLDCFSDEYSLLLDSRSSAWEGRRRSRRVAERLAAAQLALELAGSGGGEARAVLGGGGVEVLGPGGGGRDLGGGAGVGQQGRGWEGVVWVEAGSGVESGAESDVEEEGGGGDEGQNSVALGGRMAGGQGVLTGPKLWVPREAPVGVLSGVVATAAAVAAAAAGAAPALLEAGQSQRRGGHAQQPAQAGGERGTAMGLLRKVFGRWGKKQQGVAPPPSVEIMVEPQQHQQQPQEPQLPSLPPQRTTSAARASEAGRGAATVQESKEAASEALRRRRREFQQRKQVQGEAAAAAGPPLGHGVLAQQRQHGSAGALAATGLGSQH